MSNLVSWARRGARAAGVPSPWPQITLDQLPYWFAQFGYQGLGYGPTVIQTMQQNRETISADFVGYINGAYRTNGPVFAVNLCRMFLFSEARMQFRRLTNGRPGKLFGTNDLDIIEHPWPNATTGDLLARAINDVDLAGNFYATRVPRQNPMPGDPTSKIARLRPDWVTILKGSIDPQKPLDSWDPSAELIGYIYQPGGPGSGLDPHTYLPHEVMHFAPIPDPVASYRGMPWLQPVITEVQGDRAMTAHKIMYFENGATPNLVVSMDTGKMDRRTFKEWVDLFENEHAGALNAYRTLYLGNGAAATVVGSNMRDLDYSAVQGSVELRIASAGGIHPVILGFDKGLQASSLNNFANARRLTADRTLRPLWRNFAGSLETLVAPPPGSQMWYDDRDIPFLKDDESDEADILLTKSTAARLLVDAGYEPDSVVQALEANDMSQLVGSHTGLYSVQLQPPGSNQTQPQQPPQAGNQPQGALPPGGNGNGNNPAPPQPGSAASSADRRLLVSSNIGNVEELAKALLAARK